MNVHTEYDVSFIPLPNRVELMVSEKESDPALTTTAFVIPIFDNGDVLLSVHQRRGEEIPGGHIDPGETAQEAAIREAYEEAGCIVGDLTPIGFQRLETFAAVPKDYRYPHPVSYQQFYAARVIRMDPYVDNEECRQPIILTDISHHPRATVRELGKIAKEIIKKAR